MAKDDINRILDIFYAILISVAFCGPFLVILALYLLIERGPVFHKSQRIGRGGRPFLMWKFRTMMVGAPQLATSDFLDANKYITPLGTFLRKASLDELPQVLNIFLGDMSLVGPRPALFVEERLKKLRSEYKIDELRPGVTGLAQVIARDRVSVSSKVRLDRLYCQNKSIILDLKIILRTLFVVLDPSLVRH